MAGSYEHVRHGVSLIENLKDAGEAIEQLTWLVERAIGYDRAKELLTREFYPMRRGELPEDDAYKRVQEMFKG